MQHDTYFDGVELDTVDAVDAPRERPHRLCSLFIPHVYLLSTRSKHVCRPVVVDALKHCLSMSNNHETTY